MGTVEPGLRESAAAAAAAAAVWAVCDQWVANALLQHVWPDMEPAKFWSRVSLTFDILYNYTVSLKHHLLYFNKEKNCLFDLFYSTLDIFVHICTNSVTDIISGSPSQQPGWEALDLHQPRPQPRLVQSCPAWPTSAWLATKRSKKALTSM